MVLFHEKLPDGYLLVLAPDANATALTEAGLAEHLDRACRSGQPVWVDCRLLDTVSATAAWLLWACHHRLRRRRMALVLCRVSQRVERVLREAFQGADLCLAASLDDMGLPGSRIPGLACAA
jgi:anti-anti-sigma regulatory factor